MPSGAGLNQSNFLRPVEDVNEDAIVVLKPLVSGVARGPQQTDTDSISIIERTASLCQTHPITSMELFTECLPPSMKLIYIPFSCTFKICFPNSNFITNKRS